MNALSKTLLDQAIQLPERERATLADELLESLNWSDSALDKIWLREAEARMAAYRAGEIEAVDAEEVFSPHEKRA